MKYIVLLGDGMSDEPIAELGGKTPLEAAKTPNMDRLSQTGKIGLAATVPEGYPPGASLLDERKLWRQRRSRNTCPLPMPRTQSRLSARTPDPFLDIFSICRYDGSVKILSICL